MKVIANGVSRARWESVRGVSGVYAVIAHGCMAIKVGWSSDISKRLATMSMYLPFDCELIGIISTNKKTEERRIHRLLKPHKIRGEWFAWCDATRESINAEFTITEGSSEAESISEDIARNPIADLDIKIDCQQTFGEAFNSMRPSARNWFTQFQDKKGSPPTFDDLIRMYCGLHAQKLTRERIRQHITQISYSIKDRSENGGTMYDFAHLLFSGNVRELMKESASISTCSVSHPKTIDASA